MNEPLTQLAERDPLRAKYAELIIQRVKAEAPPSWRGVEVACYAVRGIYSPGSPEFEILVAEFGTPSEKEWTTAQVAYGPTAGLPGLSK